MESTDRMFIFNQANEEENMKTFARFELVKAQAGQDITIMVMRQMLPFNNPASPAIAASKMKNRAEELLKVAVDTEVDGVHLDGKRYSITGRNPYSAAFRKIQGAVALGGDLDQLQTCSACEKYTREANKKKKQEEHQAAVEKEVKDSLKQAGIDPESEEGKKKMGEELRLILGTEQAMSVEKAENTRPTDWVTDLVVAYEVQVRLWLEEGQAEQDIVQTLIFNHTKQIELQAQNAIEFLALQSTSSAA